MIRHLLPRFEAGSWGGPGLLGEPHQVDGFFVAVGWLGLHVEICLARTTR